MDGQTLRNTRNHQPLNDEVLRPGEVAELFKVSVVTVCLWADAGKLPSFRTPGGHRRFYRADVDALREAS